MSSQTQSGENVEECKRVDLTTKLLPTVARAVKLSQEFPVSDTPAFIYYNDFPQYKAIATGQSKKILSILQNILDILDAKANILDVPVNKSISEKFTSIVDANDRILEKLAMAMDFEEDPQRKEFFLKTKSEDLVVAVHRKSTTSLEWLKPKNSTEESNERTTDLFENSLKLLSSKHIVRPQISFSTPPDNSYSPFRPKIKSKPNCIQPLPKSLSNNADESIEYLHPYQVELEAFANNVPNWNAMLSDDFTVKPLDSSYQYIDKLDTLEQTVKSLSVCRYIAVDLEHHSYRSFLGITCLIQISTLDTDYIIDALALHDHLSILNEVFTDPKIVKVFHGSDSDLMWLQRDFGVYVVNLFDTGVAARLLQHGRFSLSYLLQRYVNINPNKKYQLADWRIRPLPNELIEYARTDTHYLLHIASRMCRELQDRNLLSVTFERARQLCLKCYTKPVFNRLGYLDLYKQTGCSSFSHRQLYALENLHALRDSIARREDESLHYVLPNHMLKVIAEVLPRESSGVFACCNPIPPLVRKYVHDFHKIILDARNLPIADLPLTTPDEQSLSSSTQPTLQQGDDKRSSVNILTMQNLRYALPHDHSHESHLFITDQHNIYCSEFSHNNKKSSLLASAFLPKSSSGEIIINEQNVISEKNKLFKDKFLDANHLLLTKLLELLKLPCAPLVTTTNQSSVDTNTSVQNGISQQQSSLQESSDTLNMSEQAIKTDGDTTQDESYMNNSQYSTVSQAGNSNEFKQPYKKGNIFKSTPSFGQDEVVLLCNEKTNVKSKKRRKAYKKQKSAAQFNNLNQSTDNNSDICISIKCESSSEQLSDSSVDYSFDNTPAHSSTAYGSNKKNNKPVKKFKQFRV
nr:Exosome component 10 [Schistosoma japonicum]